MIGTAILGPAFISVLIRYKQKKYEDIPKMVIEYGIYCLLTALLTQAVITYVLGISGVTQEALLSFPFFTKYVIFAIIIAALLPLAQALIEKYIKVSFEVGVYDRTREDEEKKNH